MCQLAQLNIARARFALDDPRIAEFVNAIDSVNAAAEASRGFVWRLLGGEPPPQVYGDARYVVNLSVWESVEDLRRFVASALHLGIMRRRAEWLDRVEAATLVLWWIAPDTRPSVAEAQARLDHLRAHGASPHAFDFRQTFPAPSQCRTSGASGEQPA